MIGTSGQKFQVALYTLSLVLATMGLGGRLWARKMTGTRWQVNDYVMILAYVNVAGLVIASNLAVVTGELGVHQYDIPRHRLKEIMTLHFKMTIAIPFFLVSSSFFVKMSITHFYIILFPRAHTWVHNLCKAQLVLLVLCWIAGVVPCFLACRPLAYTWDRTIPGGQCFDIKHFWLSTSIIALFFDLTCVVLPVPVFWSLNMSTAKKIKLTLVFGLGFFICALTVGRIYYDEKIEFTDLPYTAAPAVMFAVPEPSLSVFVGCLPITMPLFARASSAVKSTLASTLSRFAATATPSKADTRRHSASRSRGEDPTGAARFRKLQDHAYPMTSVVVGRSAAEDGYVEGMCPEPLRGTEEMARRNGGASPNGITVLREVHVERQDRSEFEWS